MSTRSRRVVGALAVVSVVAVLLAGCGGAGDGESATPAASSPTGSAGTAPAGPIEWVDTLPIGPPPRIGYVIGHTYHSPDGRIVQLPRDRGYTSIARLGDGYLVVDDRHFEATVGILRLDGHGRRVGVERYVAGAPVISDDGRTLRWITFTPSEFGPERQPTLLHVADVATGEIRSRRIGPPHEIRPAVRQRAGIAEVLVRHSIVIVRDRVTRVQVARLAAPGPWVRGKIRSAAREDRAHLLVSFQRGGSVAILRIDLRSGGWSLAVDWTPIERSSAVVFETLPSDSPPGPRAWVDDLPLGAPPTIGYVIGHTFHEPDGGTARPHLDGRGVTWITRLGDGFLVTDDRTFEGTSGLVRLNTDGTIDPSLTRPGHQHGYATVASPPVLSASGSTLHWLTFTPPEVGVDDPTMIHKGDVETGAITSVVVDVAPGFLTSLLGAVDDEVVFRTGWVGHGDTWVQHGTSRPQRAPALDGASTMSPRSRLMTALLGRRGKVGAVVDYDTRRVLWRRPGLTPYSFSPSGRSLLADVREGFVVLDARTGDVRGTVARNAGELPRWAIATSAWEDEHHLLVGIVRGRRAAVVRGDVRSDRWELAVAWSPLEGTRQVAFETVH